MDQKGRARLSEIKNKKLTRRQVEQVNKLIVQATEDLVCFRNDQPWVANLVRKSRYFRIEPRADPQSHGSGMVTYFREEVAEAPWRKNAL